MKLFIKNIGTLHVTKNFLQYNGSNESKDASCSWKPIEDQEKISFFKDNATKGKNEEFKDDYKVTLLGKILKLSSISKYTTIELLNQIPMKVSTYENGYNCQCWLAPMVDES